MPPVRLAFKNRVLDFPRRALVMGIVNINDDSFSGDGTLDPRQALAAARGMVEDGADIVDVGGESARTNRRAIACGEETARVLPFVRAFLDQRDGWAPRDEGQVWPPVLSVNTWRPGVVRPLLEAGAELCNDMGGLPTDENARIAAGCGAALLIMHSVGEPKQPHTSVRWRDVLHDQIGFFREKMQLAAGAGLPPEAVLLDPGLDFAKQRDDNLRLLAAQDFLGSLGRPVLMPVSRKTVIGETLNLPDPLDRDPATWACIVAGLLRGISIFRVHAVREAASAIRITDAVLGAVA
jgi:dihydropteroate synthase